MNTERRKFIRHPLNYPLKTKIISPEKEESQLSSESENIGAGGLLFTCDRPIHVGSEVEIELKLEKRIFVLDGKVVRCEKKSGPQRYSVAVTFLNPNELLKMRMMEQVVRIEMFKNRLERKYGVKLDFASVAKEWIRRYSEAFAKRYDV
jgi:hypothetical protein